MGKKGQISINIVGVYAHCHSTGRHEGIVSNTFFMTKVESQSIMIKMGGLKFEKKGFLA